MKPFIPHKLPLTQLDWVQLITHIAKANAALARYDGILQSIPNPAVLLSPLSTQEAVLSSKIEGTQASLVDVLEYEADPTDSHEKYGDITEIINYRKAMAFATRELKKMPISLNFLRKTHAILLQGVRGQNKGRGEFRKMQNWISTPGSSIETARYVPPDPVVMKEGLHVFEKYIHQDEKDILVQTAIVHAQFEIIHPFLDGNGRIGRILIPLVLYSKGLLQSPMFYISAYFEEHREAYYDNLKKITENNEWEDWVIFFLDAVIDQAKVNSKKAKRILVEYEKMKEAISSVTRSQFTVQTLDCLFHMPIFNSTEFQKFTKMRKPTANRILRQMTEVKIIQVVREGKGRRPTVFKYRKLLQLIDGK